MVVIEGKSYKTVSIPELGDAVYFRQRKELTDDDAARASSTLKSLMSAGKIAILSGSIPGSEPLQPAGALVDRQPAAVPSQEVREPEPPVAVLPEPQTSQNLVDALDGVRAVQERTNAILEAMTPAAPQPQVDVQGLVQQVAKELAKEVGISISGKGLRQAEPGVENSPDNLYIPEIRVTDMSSKITLQAKVLGSGGQVNAALDKLKKLKPQGK